MSRKDTGRIKSKADTGRRFSGKWTGRNVGSSIWGKWTSRNADRSTSGKWIEKGPFIIYIALIVAIFLLIVSRDFQVADLYLSDVLYQTGNTSSGQIVLVEKDEKALEAFGNDPSGWSRDIYATVIENLNAQEECRPAVIGLDLIFAYPGDVAADQHLAEAAGKYGNVVTASSFATEKTSYEIDDLSYKKKLDISPILPYESLAAVTRQGVADAIRDKDGRIRHGLLRFQGQKATETPSFAAVIVEEYKKNHGGATGTESITENGITTRTKATTETKNLADSTSSEFPRNNKIYIDYTTDYQGYSESISIKDIYEGNFEPTHFQGKIVLIGECAKAVDTHLTAYDRQKGMYGVVVHANIIDMLLEGRYYKEVNDILQAGILLLASILSLLMFVKGSLPWMLGTWAILSAGSAFACVKAYHWGYVFHPLWIPCGVSILFVVGITRRYLVESIKRRHLKAQFGKYVDPQVLEQILREGEDSLKLQGIKKTVVVLFADICGFTTLSEQIAPEEVVRILNRFLEITTECIMRHGGTLDKFIGDCAMAIWNAPYEQEDAEESAIQAAFDMIRETKILKSEFGHDIELAIGIHCGEAIIGNIGSTKRMDYTAIGDTVNTASRLESLKIPGMPRAGQIYVSQSIVDALELDRQGDIVYEDLGLHGIKGKEHELKVYRMLGETTQ